MTSADRRAVDPAWVRTEPCRFHVEGKPETKGSARAFMKPGMKFPIVTSDNPKCKRWEKAIHMAAKIAMGSRQFSAPLTVQLSFRLQRPLSLKGVNVWHTTRPDLDKLVRAVLDGLTGACYSDDGQVVAIEAGKRYANPDEGPGVSIYVEPTGEIQPAML